jgi:mRNA turnover protein 4
LYHFTWQGQCGLLFTDQSEQDVIDYFDTFVEKDYARSGAKATETVVLEEGPLTQFAHNIEPHLRSLGMPTQLKKGVVTLLQEFEVCKKGKPLTPNQANILVRSPVYSVYFKELEFES